MVNLSEIFPFLTPEQVAEVLQVSAKTVRRLARTGKLPHVRIGRQIRSEREVLEKSSSRTAGSDDSLANENGPTRDVTSRRAHRARRTVHAQHRES